MNRHLSTCVALFFGATSVACAQLEVQHARPPDTRAVAVSWAEIDRADVTMLNDISFDRYHIFRTESHVLTDFTPGEK